MSENSGEARCSTPTPQNRWDKNAMSNEQIIEQLQSFGFSPIEARVYLTLASEKSALTGYQIAKMANLPRPNVYPALKRLVRRGACVEQPEGSSIRYMAVPFTVVGQSHVKNLQMQVEQLAQMIPEPSEENMVTRVEGTEALLVHGRRLIERATTHLDVGSSVGLITLFVNDLAKARERGVHQRYLCFDNCPVPGCGLCVAPLPITLENFRQTGWLTMIRDKQEALIVTGYPARPQVLLTTMEPVIFSLNMLINLRESLISVSKTPH
ncbi:TrmB family transcriptional regulator [Sulfobacillus thermosulfidooxidans]|uniref:TrmB family transcriptional regulator n=1 Tax=Sulfobacillus thermosulfidooxidans TaxID=28034 RepID=UPI000B09CE40|nr:helix-turn-helix domain-containing protein [Sulfobacillus thermosulfidooxidans]